MGGCFQVYFDSDEVHACIVTCGGLCPGLNTVIREIVTSLYYMYGVKRVLGIDVSGYCAINFNNCSMAFSFLICIYFFNVSFLRSMNLFIVKILFF